MSIQPDIPLRFLRAAFEPDDWVAVLLKSHQTGRTAQRVGPVALVADARFQAWLRAQNAARSSVYVSVNAVTPGQRSRRRDAIRAIRHIFVDADHEAPAVLAVIDERRDLPTPSYVLHSSRHRAHVLWRVRHFPNERAEALQKQLAGELGTDPAATSCAQMTRLPAFLNYKHSPPPVVTIEYRSADVTYTPEDFPTPSAKTMRARAVMATCAGPRCGALERARQYMAAFPPAVAGQHGDLQTFRLCCRLVRGFALTDTDALSLLAEWNARCQPPWSDRELAEKLSRARRYGREPIGGLLEAQS